MVLVVKKLDENVKANNLIQLIANILFKVGLLGSNILNALFSPLWCRAQKSTTALILMYVEKTILTNNGIVLTAINC